MSDQFFPEGFEPQSGGQSDRFLKIKDEARVRVLAPPYIYFQGWKEQDGKPKPVRSWQPFPSDAGPWKEAPKQVVGLFVWDVQEDGVKFWEVTQVGIQRELYNLSKDADYGSPLLYDLKISKTGSGKESKYTVRPMPPKPMPAMVIDAWNAEAPTIDLQAYMDGNQLFKE